MSELTEKQIKNWKERQRSLYRKCKLSPSQIKKLESIHGWWWEKEFLPFKEAREFVRNLQFNNQDEWQKYCISGKKPLDIPSSPKYQYKNTGYLGMGDWLGTGNQHTKDFLPFEEAREFVRNLELKGSDEWVEWYKSDKRKEDIPTAPDRVYKDLGWVNLGDWLGTGFISFKERQYRSFKEAREFVRTLSLKSEAEWRKYIKSDYFPKDIPMAPDQKYNEWVSMGDWLGTGYIAHKYRTYRLFAEARDFVCNLKLKSNKEWIDYCKSGEKPDDIPGDPSVVYKDEWTNSGDWLGTGYIANNKRGYRPFKEAREFARSLKIKNENEWRKYAKSGKKPDDIPYEARNIYADKWISMGDWLGTGYVYKKTVLPFEEARNLVRSWKLKTQKEWYERKMWGKNLPAHPDRKYKNKGWISWPDFLGTK